MTYNTATTAAQDAALGWPVPAGTARLRPIRAPSTGAIAGSSHLSRRMPGSFTRPTMLMVAR